jgi:hypothetical protein
MDYSGKVQIIFNNKGTISCAFVVMIGFDISIISFFQKIILLVRWVILPLDQFYCYYFNIR